MEESIITSNIELELKCMNHLMMLFQPVKKNKLKLQMMVSKLSKQKLLPLLRLHIMVLTIAHTTVLFINHMEIIDRDTSPMERALSKELLVE